MKLVKKITKKPVSPCKNKPKVTALPSGEIEIWHSQSIKQSKNYQSCDATYGVKLTVPNDPKSIRKGIAAAEEIVEDSLVLKVREQGKVIASLG